MELNVLLFASWAEALGGPNVTLSLPERATVADVLRAATERAAERAAGRAAGRALPRPLVAVNHKYAKPEAPVRAGDEVAIIPPVAGG